MAFAALAIGLLSSISRERLLEMLEPRYVKSPTTSCVKLSMEMLGVLLMCWNMILVFFKPDSLHAWVRQLMGR